MIAASVGFQCPDDVRAGAQGVRQPRTAFGGAVTAGSAVVTLSLVAVNALVYLVQLTQPDLAVRFGNLALAFDGRELVGVAEGEYYRLLTAAFLHANVFHLLTNMFALFTVGPQLEAALGRSRFLVLYVLGALGGSTLSYLLSTPGTVGVGASGAVFALFGAFYVVVRRLGGETGPLVALIAINVVITFAVPIIDWRAHLGGLVTGALVAAAFAYAPRGPRRALVQGGGCTLVAALLVLAVVLRTGALAL